MKPKHLIILIYSLVVSQNHIVGQNRTTLGINVVNEIVQNDWSPGIGANIAIQYSEHGAFETGIYLRSYAQNYSLYIIDNQIYTTISERFISIPLLYEYRSALLNFGIGSTVDIFTGWKQKYANDETFTIEDYTISPRLAYGFLIKVDREIKVTEDFYIIPELRINEIVRLRRFYYGIGINFKYELNSRKRQNEYAP